MHLFRVALVATLLLPPVLLYTRAVGDALLSLVAILFLARSCILRDWRWLNTDACPPRAAILAVAGGVHAARRHTPGTRRSSRSFAGCFCSRPPWRVGCWLITSSGGNFAIVVLAVGVWTVVETWQQYLLGANLFGYPRWGCCILTGPMTGPRDGATLQMLYLPAFLPLAMDWLGRPSRPARAAGALLLFVTMLAEVLIGQRMPMVLLLFSLCLTGLVVRRFRWPIAIALVAIIAAIAAAPVLSPVTYATLVLVFFDRMRDFWNTPYAWLFERAIVMIQAHPWLGLGFDGFRDNCMDPRYLKAVAWLPVTDINNPEGCSIHPHNYWLQIATSDGLAGVLLFAALSVTWLVRIGSRLLSGARPIQVALFVTLCTMLWPITSTTSLFTLPNAGWVFLTIGWGLAEYGHADARDAAPASLPP